MAGIERDLMRRAAARGGLLTRADLGAAGLTAKVVRRWCRDGLIRPVTRDVFAAGAVVVDSDRRELAALWQAGPDAALSHASAGRDWALPKIGVAVPEVVIPHGRPRPRATIGRVHVSRRLDPGSVVELRGRRVTAPGRTLVDLAPRLTRAHLTECLQDLRRRGLVDLSALHEEVIGPGHRRVAGAGTIAGLVAALACRPVGESWLEDEFVGLVAAAGISLPETQVVVVVDGCRYRVDTLWPHRRLIVELDGHEFHSSRADRSRDAERAARLTGAGFDVVVFTYDDVVSRPGYVLDTVAGRLGVARAA